MRPTDEGPFPEADRFPPAHDAPVFELEAVGRSLDDLAPAEKRAPVRGVRTKLEWSAAALIALIAFVGWLLVGR